jgi:hypothetical protein
MAFIPQVIDFSALEKLGEIPGRLRERELRGKFADGAFKNPDGSINYNEMYNAVGGVNPLAAAKLAQNHASNNSMLDVMKFNLANKEHERKVEAGRRLTPTDKKAVYSAEDDVVGLETMLTNFKEAEGFLNEGGDGAGIYDGYGAGIAADVGTKLPGGASKWLGEKGFIDTGKAQRTQDFLSIMTPQAMQFMAEQLKGSTAFQELLAFKAVYADPNTPNKTKAGLLRRLIQATEANIENKRRRVNELKNSGGSGGGSAVEVDDGGSVWDANGKEYTIVDGQPVPVEQ